MDNMFLFLAKKWQTIDELCIYQPFSYKAMPHLLLYTNKNSNNKNLFHPPPTRQPIINIYIIFILYNAIFKT
ncbi:hypothetical protein, partial [Escherichia ruysiae]|uniref:hypothetical protein n=1 Tax=Escherichia ruysiae TaxID=2608867 RepID=UPI003F4ABF9F